MKVGLLSNFLTRQRMACLPPFLSGAILDIGCGWSPFLQAFPGAADYTGVDKWSHVIESLRLQYPGKEFHVRNIDREELSLPRRYDTILMMAVIEHLENPGLIISQIPALLAPGGKIVLTTPTPLGNLVHHYGSNIWLFSSEAAEEHHLIFNFVSLQKLLNTYNLKILTYRTFQFGGNQLCVAGSMDR